MWKPAGIISLGLALIVYAAFVTKGEAVDQENRELIVLAAPLSNDPYYEEVADEIFNFHIAYARQIMTKDNVLILTDEESYDKYADALGAEHVLIAPQDDIWTRDFSLSNLINPVMFRYTAAAQASTSNPQSAADEVQETFAEILVEADLTFAESDLLNDGGNFVDDYAGRAVLSRKFLKDNKLSEKKARAALKEALNLDYIAFIEADEQGGLEHADGVVAFIDKNVLVINSYPEDPDYAENLKANLRDNLPDVTIHEIVTPYDGSDIYDGKFGSACGLYTNMLVTNDRIYLPQFGIVEDRIALQNIRRWTTKEIIPVQSGNVCFMGGGVRCMSWQLRDNNAARFLDWAKQRQETY